MQADCFAELRRFMLVKNYTATSTTLRDVQRLLNGNTLVTYSV